MTLIVRVGSDASCELYVTDQLQRFNLDHDQSRAMMHEVARSIEPYLSLLP